MRQPDDMEEINSTVKIYYQSLLEILGEKKARAIFSRMGLSNPEVNIQELKIPLPNILEGLAAALSNEYGELACQGLLIRMGRASISFFRHHYKSIAALGNIENRLQPIERRFLFSLTALANLVTRETRIEIEVIQENTRQFLWKMFLNEKKDKKGNLSPYYYFGVLEEFCFWLDARKNYQLSYLADKRKKVVEIAIEIRPQE